MRDRIPIGAIAFVAVALVAAFAGRIALLVFLLGVAIATGGEMYRVARARGVRPIALAGLLSIAAMLVSVHVARRESALPIVVVASLGLSFLMMLARKRRQDVTRALIYTLIPVLVVGMLTAYIVALRVLPGGFRLVVTLGMIAIGADAGAAFIASRAGQHAAARAWWRRLIGGLAGALFGAVLAALLFSPPVTWGRALALALFVAPAVTVADALAAMLEDDFGGAGLLRKVDGVLFAAPVFFYAYQVLAR